MKKLITLFVLTLGLSLPVFAEDITVDSANESASSNIIVVDTPAVNPTATTEVITVTTQTSLDQEAQDAWEKANISSTTTKYVFTAITAYDCLQGELLYGASTKVFRPTTLGYLNYFSGDFAIFTTAASGSHGIPAGAITFHVNDLISDKAPSVAKVINSLPAGDTVFSKLTVSGWAARDFYAGIWRAGAFAGFEIKL